jgi:hypothetical protein
MALGHGGARAGAGRPKKSAHDHWLAGTTDRLPKPTPDPSSNVTHLPPVHDPRADLGDGWSPSRSQRARLGRAGRAYLDDVVSRFDIANTEAAAVLTIASHHDAIDRLHLLLKKATLIREHVQLERLILERQKLIDAWHAKLVEGAIDATESVE